VVEIQLTVVVAALPALSRASHGKVVVDSLSP